jgi:hypothetical protein
MTTFTIARGELINGITTALAFAGTDDTLPMLTGVDLSIRNGRLIFSATDRFRLAVIRVYVADLAGEDGRLGFLDRKAARKLLTLIRGGRVREKGLPVKVAVTTDKVTGLNELTVDDYATKITSKLVDVEFPRYDRILRDTLQLKGAVDQWAVNPEHLAAFKVARWQSGLPAIVRAAEPNRPIIVTVGDHFIGMQMPVRMTDDVMPEHDWAEFLAEPKFEPEAKPAPKKNAPAKRAPRKTTAKAKS